MKWEKKEQAFRVPIKSWCGEVEPGALIQAENLARHEKIFRHVALMPDCHQGFGMPIGGVIACERAVIPNAVGVDIGCGMGAIVTDCLSEKLKSTNKIRTILDFIKRRVPLGEGHAYKTVQKWAGFKEYLEKNEIALNGKLGRERPGWLDDRAWELALRNLGTLGGGNHFIEIQESEDGFLWLMLHSGSRNLGYRIADHYHRLAISLCEKMRVELPSRELAWLDVESDEGIAYVRDMTFALAYARENRARMMEVLKNAVAQAIPGIGFLEEINIHHNYANRETHFGRTVWVHRKGATSAQLAEKGIIPGSMGTPSYIVEGLGNPDSFESCSHGAGRRMGRKEACRRLDVNECLIAMQGVVFDGFKKLSGGRNKKENLYDLEEAPFAYKNIEIVIEEELDLIRPLVKLRPLGVLKG